MKKISAIKLKKELTSINADPATIELITNSLSMYNDLVDKYIAGTIGRDIYLLYQIQASLVKQMAELKKATKQINSEDEKDSFDEMISSLKKIGNDKS